MSKFAAVALLSIAFLYAGTARAQEHNQFNDKDRQNATNWYSQHEKNPPTGLRSKDRLKADEEAKLRPGEALDRNLWKKVHSAPRDLRRHLAPPPRHYAYELIGGHLILVDTRNHQVKDVIRLRHD
ncbi:MAG TPA: hypothetical protein VLV86_18000 [Vicinamibacterales bacterium]|nr:hypothetical protein [Vicinamibacterales bacterium]